MPRISRRYSDACTTTGRKGHAVAAAGLARQEQQRAPYVTWYEHAGDARSALGPEAQEVSDLTTGEQHVEPSYASPAACRRVLEGVAADGERPRTQPSEPGAEAGRSRGSEQRAQQQNELGRDDRARALRGIV